MKLIAWPYRNIKQEQTWHAPPPPPPPCVGTQWGQGLVGSEDFRRGGGGGGVLTPLHAMTNDVQTCS